MERLFITLALLVISVNSENSTITHDASSDTCDAIGPWSQALEDWATSPQSDRHGRIMALPPTKGYYVTERIDTPYLSPPPPPISHLQTLGPQNQGYSPPSDSYLPQNQGYSPPSDSYLPQNQGHMSPSQGHIPLNQVDMPPSQGHIPLNQGHTPPNQSQMLHKKGRLPPKKSPQPHNNGQSYKEWEAQPPGASKIVNRPPNPNKNKPNYPVDRVDDPLRKQVSETDLYLLGAIEKLVYRADLMEKRLRAVEDSLHELLSGADAKPDSCPDQFMRVGSACYSFGTPAEDWKRAALACRAQRGALAELLDHKQRRAVFSKLLADKTLKGNDFWTGGLNPGLLWIWSHSARPVSLDDNNNTTSNNNNSTTTSGANIPGEGRCLSLLFDPARNSYTFRGRDCATQLRYICQIDEDREQISNDIQRAARKLRTGRRSKLLWD